MIPIKIHAYVPADAVTSDGQLRPSEKDTVEVWVPAPIHGAPRLPTDPAKRDTRPPGCIGLLVHHVEADGTTIDPNDPVSRPRRIPMLEVPYAGWRVSRLDEGHDGRDGEEAPASVLDSKGKPVVSFHRAHPTTGASPTEQAHEHLAALRRSGHGHTP